MDFTKLLLVWLSSTAALHDDGCPISGDAMLQQKSVSAHLKSEASHVQEQVHGEDLINSISSRADLSSTRDALAHHSDGSGTQYNSTRSTAESFSAKQSQGADASVTQSRGTDITHGGIEKDPNKKVTFQRYRTLNEEPSNTAWHTVCGPNQVVGWLESEYNSRVQDRNWKIVCVPVIGATLENCTEIPNHWSGWHDYDYNSLPAHDNAVSTGVRAEGWSMYSGGGWMYTGLFARTFVIRKMWFTYCDLKGAKLDGQVWTTKNTVYGTVSEPMPDRTFCSGVAAWYYYNGMKSDHQFQFRMSEFKLR